MKLTILFIAISVFLIAFILATILSPKFRKGLSVIFKYIWRKMEFYRLLSVVAATFRTVIRVLVAPVLFIDKYLETHIKSLNDYLKSRTYTEQKARSRMIEGIIDSVTHTKNVLGGRISKKIKFLCIILLEIVSFITTAIGLMIIASDISPMIAIVWAIVIQLLVGFLAVTGGKRNIIILIICLVVSMGSDYVCYINAVFPYDQYIETQYTNFKRSYDPAWERAMQLVQDFESSDKKIDTAFDNVDQGISLLRRTYNNELQNINGDIQTGTDDLSKIDKYIVDKSGTNTVNPDGSTTSVQSTNTKPNQDYSDQENYIHGLETEKTNIENKLGSLDELQKNYSALNGANNQTARDRAKELFAASVASENTQSESAITSGEVVDSNNNDDFSVFSGQFIKIQTEFK